jgi:hypothetical protein
MLLVRSLSFLDVRRLAARRKRRVNWARVADL